MSEKLYRMVRVDVDPADEKESDEDRAAGYKMVRVEMNPHEAAAIQAEWSANAKAAEATAYIDARRNEYPSVGDQLDALWKGGADADAMRKRIMEVKAKYPKPM